MDTDQLPRPESPTRLLVVHISRPSSSSSADSPLNTSPTTSILFPNGNASSSSDSTSATPPTALNVKFAPLPDLSKRKKKYHHPLGVAARSEIMRRRKAAMEGTYRDADNQHTVSPMWTDSEVREGYHRRHRPVPRRTVMGDEETELLEDPLITLGKMVKGASKSLWKKVATHKREGKEGVGDSESEGGKVSSDGEIGPQLEKGAAGKAPTGDGSSKSKDEDGEGKRERKSSSSKNGDRNRKQSWTSIIDAPPPAPATNPTPRKGSLASSLRRRSGSSDDIDPPRAI